MYFKNILSKASKDIIKKLDALDKIGILENYYNSEIKIINEINGSLNKVLIFQYNNELLVAKISLDSKRLYKEYITLSYLFEVKFENFKPTYFKKNKVYILINQFKKGTPLRDFQINIDSNYISLIENIGFELKKFHEITEISNNNNSSTNIIHDFNKCEENYWVNILYDNLKNEVEYIISHVDTETNSEIIKSFNNINKVKKEISKRNYNYILHGDLSSRNIYINKNDGIKIDFIDFEDSIFGDYLFDISNFLSFYKMLKFKDVFINSYNKNFSSLEKKIMLIYLLRICINKCVLSLEVNDIKNFNSNCQKIYKCNNLLNYIND